MNHAQVGIIGGTALGDALLDIKGARAAVETPFGLPSIPPILTSWEGVDVAFISRHGDGHQFSPSSVPYRANIWALKTLGVTSILSFGITGSLREEIAPGDFVVCDQILDRTTNRECTFFTKPPIVHVEFADPFCPRLRESLIAAGETLETAGHSRGTYVCIEGPQLSTRAESRMHRAWGGDLVGMTAMPEAKLAREAEICYALIGLPTDYDCWRPIDQNEARPDLHGEVRTNLDRARDNAIALLRATLRVMPAHPVDCRCQQALESAIWSRADLVDDATRQELGLLIGRYLPPAVEKVTCWS